MAERRLPLNTNGGPERTHPQRILMLVPHEPERDPRVRWVTQLCAEIGPTEVVGATYPLPKSTASERPSREYDGATYLERINMHEYSSKAARLLSRVTWSLTFKGATRRYIERENLSARSVSTTKGDELLPGDRVSHLRRLLFCNQVRKAFEWIDHKIGALQYGLTAWSSYNIIIGSLYRRGRAVCIIPRLILCHDIFALAAGVKIKKLYGCPIIYDAHEFWPEADTVAPRWARRFTAFIEQKLIRQADVVVTVNPHLARHLEHFYRIAKVVSAPNAEPRRNHVPSTDRVGSLPIRFLLQGGAARQRGFEELLHAWSDLNSDEVVLYLRCPENDYFASLRRHFREVIGEKKVVILQPVREENLVQAASFADVGLIPYMGPNLNHVLCCPNKLSQYMQAGLAILSNRLLFVSEVIQRYQCGLIYDARKPETFIEAVRFLIQDPEALQAMKRNSSTAAQTAFNWECQSVEYRAVIRDLCYR